MKNLKAKTTLGLLTLVGASLLQTAALATADNPGVVPPKGTYAGKSYGAWADAWWQWACSIPATTSPLLDATGQDAGQGQSRPVWFLAGNFGGTTERTVTVPADKALFFPILNYIWINVPTLGDNPWSKDQESFARDLIGATIDTATGFACEIDGRSVKSLASYRCRTAKGAAFMVNIPNGDIFDITDGAGLPPGSYGPSLNDCIYTIAS